MQRPYNDRWERTKWYLFRNLLEYPGFRLSPVPEESRSESSDDRPYSPLPDLIIEREPNRHDETEEFYQGLEARMKRYYKRLFVDGEECEGVTDSDAEISGFEVNQSMASTFIINANDHELCEANELRTNEYRFDSEKITVGRADRFDEIGNSSNSNNTDSEHSSRNERTEAITAGHKSEDMRVQSNESETIDTESDSPQDCHKKSITKVEINEEKKRSKTLTRVFEDGSPVLIPRCNNFSRIVFGHMSKDIINIIPSDDIVILEDVGNDKLEEDEGSVHIIESHSKEPIHLEISSEESDLELQWLMKNPRASSTAYCQSLEGEVTDTCEQIIDQHEDQEEIAKDDDDHEAIAENEKIYLLQSESDDEQFMTVGSRGTDEFNPSGAVPNINIVDNSIEMAIRKGMFETKNRVKISSFRTSEGENGSEEFEDVEVMRGTLHTRIHESLQRKSTSSQESPIVSTFATKTTATEIEEDSDHVNDLINASVEQVEDIPTEFHQSFERASTSTQDSSSISTLARQAEENEHPNEDGNESNEIAHTTPSFKHTKCVKDACNDIWSVSPININFEELPPHDLHKPISAGGIFNENKRETSEIIEDTAPKNKRKKFKNAEIQTSATKKTRNTWNNINTNLFVGSPLIYKLCGCKDHVCS